MIADDPALPAMRLTPWVLASFPIACFSGALVTDVVYALTADFVWADFSAWLLAAGMVMGVLAAAAGLVELARRRDRRRLRRWPLLVGGAAVLALGVLDNLVHSRDAWTSVVPAGLALSAVIVLVMLAAIWLAAAPARGVRA